MFCINFVLSVFKPGHSTGLEEWRSNGDTPESLKDEDSLRKDRNLTESRHSSESSRNADENCAKNLLNDFSAEVTTTTHPSARLSSDQHSEGVPVDNDSAPVSPAIPARFRKISNITPPRIRRKMGTGECSYIMSIYVCNFLSIIGCINYNPLALLSSAVSLLTNTAVKRLCQR